ncbi:hypothetical protein TVAGG3_0457940 [Trichomonas vaginalis G3]|uniref:hypothetical protein n=1 Tax=Trichomonas vaginalis (strain ATCC PRA-98 / G3) TaxID=412133 RepID=UPI0021E57395|nr:hypothetical protein TVAGG3_0457940 [Trichomonas vaginalis G3]KAI5514205.1 hypothetical protein TVAGG3_0457940 [Trichomonas vaginalis G3]
MRYDSYTFRRNLNIEMGESDGIVENSRYFKECETVKKWTYVDEGEQKSLIYSACIPSANQGESFLTQIEINLTHFNQYFATYALINKSKYTFLDQYKRVVFESTNGMTQPTKEDAILNYPLIEELSGDIWGPISSQLNVSQENFSLRSFHYQNHFYFTILIPIKIEYDQTHYVILLCDFSEMIADSLWETTKVYFVYLMFALYPV